MSICKILSLLLFVLIIFHIINISNLDNKEGYRGRRRGRRRWYGQDWGYRYRPPPRYSYWNWRSFPVWGSIPFWGPYVSEYCPTGCSNLGRGRWGCTNPGNGPNDCVFAVDCAPCGY